MRTDRRGQSETVGIVLLTAVFVVLSVVVGVFLLANFDGSDQTEPTIEITTDVKGQEIVVEHVGGDGYDPDDVAVVVRGESEYRWQLSELRQQTGAAQRSFSPGDRRVRDIAGLSGEVEILVVDESSGELLHESTHVIEVGAVQFENVDIPGEVKQGEEVTVTADLVNTGDVNLTQNVTTTFTNESNDAVVYSERQNKTVTYDESQRVEFNYTVGQTETSDLDVELSTGGTSVFGTVSALEISELLVDINTSASSLAVTDEENVTVVADLENTGETDLTQRVKAVVNETTQSSTEVSVLAGQQATAKLQFPAESGFDGQNVTVSTEDDSANATLQVDTVGELQIDNLNAPATAAQGEQITVSANITNTGDVELPGDIEFVVSNSTGTINTTTTSQNLGGGEETTINFTHKIEESQDEDITVEIRTKDNTRSETVQVLEAGELLIETLTTPDQAQRGETITASATLNNTGEVDLTQDVQLIVTESNIENSTKRVTVSETENPTVDFEFQIPYDQTDNITINVQTANDSMDQSVVVADTTVWARGDNERYLFNNDLIAEFSVDTERSEIQFAVDLDQGCFFACGWQNYEITIDGTTYQLTTAARDDLVSNTYIDLLDPENYDENGIASELRVLRAQVDSDSLVKNKTVDRGELYVDVQEEDPESN